VLNVSVAFIILTGIDLIAALALIVLILMQSKNAQGFSASNLGTTGGSSVQTYWDKNKGRSIEGKMEKYTKICAFLFFVITLALNVIK